MVCDTFLAGARGAEFVQPLHGSVAGGVEAKPRGEVRCRHRHGMGPRGDVAEKCQKNRDKQHQTPSGTPWYQHLFIVLRVFKDLFNWFSHFS